MDDDNYLNVGSLLRLLSQHSHTQDVYIGRPSLERPIEATENPGTPETVASLTHVCDFNSDKHVDAASRVLAFRRRCVSGSPRAERDSA